MERYARAKRRLFEGAGGAVPRFGVINADDPTGREFLKLRGFEAISYGRRKDAAVTAKAIEVDLSGCRMTVTTPRGKLDLRSSLRGGFNVSNILAAVAAGLAAEIDLQVIRAGIQRCPAVPGRFEPVQEGQDFLVIVDYAHTDDALKNLIESARGLLTRQEKRGRVITVFGCGGDRDRTKRPAMGEIAARLSDHVILTSDNPRTEDPLLIINDVRVGLQRVGVDYEVEADRALAIRKAIGQARSNDIVLLAGKGHETYQIVGRESLPFDDRQVAREVLREKGYGSRPPSRSYLREGEAAS
jgi:UDP-N-acetylmuramoyl-L-alanyl-D-glutamate--2,6-diaminopimelate ligase